jgi:hypothetical protein
MKNKIASVLIVVVCFCTNMSFAQKDSTRKGHFVFGSNILSFSASSYKETITAGSGYGPDINKSTYSIMSVTFNLWAGYFISNSVCIGLNFGNPSSSIIEPYLGYDYNSTSFSSIIPSGFFFRYYLNQDDNNIASFFLEGSVGGSYSSISSGGVSNAISLGNLNTNLNIVISIHTIKNLDVQLRAGFSYNDYYFRNPSDYGESADDISSPAFLSSLGLQYKL